MASERNLKFVAHIIKDIFHPKEGVLTYGTQFDLIPVLRDPEFGIEAFGLHTNTNIQAPENTFFWNIGVNNSHFGTDHANLVISIDYERNLQERYLDLTALHMHNLLKNDGLVFAVNPGNWISSFYKIFQSEPALEEEVKRYSLFKNDQVFIYRK